MSHECVFQEKYFGFSGGGKWVVLVFVEVFVIKKRTYYVLYLRYEKFLVTSQSVISLTLNYTLALLCVDLIKY